MFWNCRTDPAATKSRRIRYAFLSLAPRHSSPALRSLPGGRHADSTRWWQPDHARGAKVAGLDAKRTLPRTGGCAGGAKFSERNRACLRHQTPEDIEEPFQQTGTLHLFAVAGLHVGIIAALLWMLAMVARLSRKWAAALIIPLLLFYAAVTGLHVSSVRAAVMSSVLLGGLFFERKVFVLNSLAAAAFFLLCWNTNELFSTGFQLSFAVVGAITLFANPLFGFLQRWGAPDPFLPRSLLRGPRRLMHVGFEWLCRGASVSVAAWIGSLPFILWYFHIVTPISLFANLVVVPIAFFILAIALLSLLS